MSWFERAGQSLYSYAVPDELADSLCIGELVQVPLRNRKIHGFVQSIEQREKPSYRLRSVAVAKRRGADPRTFNDLGGLGESLLSLQSVSVYSQHDTKPSA